MMGLQLSLIIVIRTWLCSSHLGLALWFANLGATQKADANVQPPEMPTKDTDLAETLS